MELRQLRYFVAIVDCGSLSRAASQVHIVQPALSQQMAQLEEELEVQLLQRSVKGVIPTDAGLALYRHAKQVLKLVSDTRDVTRASASELSGRVKLGLPSSIAMVLVGPLIATLEERCPRICLEIHESPSAYLAAQLHNEWVDLAVLVGDVAMPGIELSPLVDECLYFVQPRKSLLLPCGDSASLQQLAGVPLMLTTHATTLRRLVDEAFAAAAVEPIVKGEASSIQTLLSIVAQGGAGSLVPHSALAWHGAGQLLQQTVIAPHIVRSASLARSRLNPLSPTSAFVHAAVREVVTHLVREHRWVDVRTVL